MDSNRQENASADRHVIYAREEDNSEPDQAELNEALDMLSHAVSHIHDAIGTMEMKMERTHGSVVDITLYLKNQGHKVKNLEKKLDCLVRKLESSGESETPSAGETIVAVKRLEGSNVPPIRATSIFGSCCSSSSSSSSSASSSSSECSLESSLLSVPSLVPSGGREVSRPFDSSRNTNSTSDMLPVAACEARMSCGVSASTTSSIGCGRDSCTGSLCADNPLVANANSCHSTSCKDSFNDFRSCKASPLCVGPPPTSPTDGPPINTPPKKISANPYISLKSADSEASSLHGSNIPSEKSPSDSHPASDFTWSKTLPAHLHPTFFNPAYPDQKFQYTTYPMMYYGNVYGNSPFIRNMSSHSTPSSTNLCSASRTRDPHHGNQWYRNSSNCASSEPFYSHSAQCPYRQQFGSCVSSTYAWVTPTTWSTSADYHRSQEMSTQWSPQSSRTDVPWGCARPAVFVGRSPSVASSGPRVGNCRATQYSPRTSASRPVSSRSIQCSPLGPRALQRPPCSSLSSSSIVPTSAGGCILFHSTSSFAPSRSISSQSVDCCPTKVCRALSPIHSKSSCRSVSDRSIQCSAASGQRTICRQTSPICALPAGRGRCSAHSLVGSSQESLHRTSPPCAPKYVSKCTSPSSPLSCGSSSSDPPCDPRPLPYGCDTPAVEYVCESTAPTPSPSPTPTPTPTPTPSPSPSPTPSPSPEPSPPPSPTPSPSPEPSPPPSPTPSPSPEPSPPPSPTPSPSPEPSPPPSPTPSPSPEPSPPPSPSPEPSLPPTPPKPESPPPSPPKEPPRREKCCPSRPCPPRRVCTLKPKRRARGSSVPKCPVCWAYPRNKAGAQCPATAAAQCPATAASSTKTYVIASTDYSADCSADCSVTERRVAVSICESSLSGCELESQPSLRAARADQEVRAHLGIKLLRAATEGNMRLVRKLLDEGIDVNYTFSSKWTALHRATRMGHVKIVCLLLSRGADVNRRTLHDFTPLHVAAYYDFTGRCIDLLIIAGANVNCRNRSGRTPLHYAAEFGNAAAAMALVARGANNVAMDDRGMTPIDLADSDYMRKLLCAKALMQTPTCVPAANQ